MMMDIQQAIQQAPTVDEKLALVQGDLEELEQRVALIEAMLAAIRSEDDTEQARAT